MRIYHIILSLALFAVSCKKGIWSDAGEQKSEERTTLPFTQILLYDNVSLVLTQDTVDRIRVEAPAKILPDITTTMDGHSLTIRNRNRSLLNAPGETIRVYANVRNLQRIDYLGAADITCTNILQSPYFTILSSNGSGNVRLTLNSVVTDALLYSDMADFTFEGQSDSCYTYCNSLGTIDYRGFTVRRMNLDHSGIRDAYVHVTERLTGRIFYKGNVYYRGYPLLQKEETSSGRFLPW